MGGAVLRLHGGVREIGNRVLGLHVSHRACKAGGNVTIRLADLGLPRVQPDALEGSVEEASEPAAID